MVRSIEALTKRQIIGISKVNDNLRNRHLIGNKKEFLRLIRRTGYTINGNRTYYLCNPDGEKILIEGRPINVPAGGALTATYTKILTSLIIDAQERYPGILD